MAAKDTMFKLQCGYPDYRAELFNYITGSCEATESNVEDYTIDMNNISTARRNDLCIVVNDKLMLLTEAQSTRPYNMLFRMLMYYSDVMERWMAKHDYNAVRPKNFQIPVPEFCVLCTGDAPKDDVLFLSDSFLGRTVIPQLSSELLFYGVQILRTF